MAAKMDGEKSLSVVFESKKLMKNFVMKPDRKQKLEERYKKLVKDNTCKPILRSKLHVVMQTDFSKTNDLKHMKFAHLMKSMHSFNAQESHVLDKFVTEVESLATQFSTEFNKWQDLYENIKKKIPQLQAEKCLEDSSLVS